MSSKKEDFLNQASFKDIDFKDNLLVNTYLKAKDLKDSTNKKDVLKIGFIDFWSDFKIRDNFFTRLLSKAYKLEIYEESEFLSAGLDIMLCSCFGDRFKKYKFKRILFIGENIVPNFNAYDYALSFEFLQYGCRHFRLPLWYVYLDEYLNKNPRDYIDARSSEELLCRDFASIVVSNNMQTSSIREDFFRFLSKYKHVSSGGRAFNNIGTAVENKHLFIKNYKFNIAFENSLHEGYVTEKIMESFLARCVPIYFGDKSVINDFNKDSFININDFASFEEALKHIKEINEDKNKMLDMLNANPFNPLCLEDLKDSKILSFFKEAIKNPRIYHKDSLAFRDHNGGYLKTPFYIKLLSAFIFKKSLRVKFRDFLIKRHRSIKY